MKRSRRPSKRAIVVTASTPEELKKLVHERRRVGYVIPSEVGCTVIDGLTSIVMARRADYTSRNWSWTDRDIAELIHVIKEKEIPLVELNFQSIRDEYIPERTMGSIRDKFRNVCKDIYGISYDDFTLRRRAAYNEAVKPKPRVHVSKKFGRKLDTVTRAVQVIEGDITSPEVIMIRGEVYVKQKAAQ